MLIKGNISTESIDYLGQVVRPRPLDIASHSTDAINELIPSTKITVL